MEKVRTRYTIDRRAVFRHRGASNFPINQTFRLLRPGWRSSGTRSGRSAIHRGELIGIGEQARTLVPVPRMTSEGEGTQLSRYLSRLYCREKLAGRSSPSKGYLALAREIPAAGFMLVVQFEESSRKSLKNQVTRCKILAPYTMGDE